MRIQLSAAMIATLRWLPLVHRMYLNCLQRHELSGAVSPRRRQQRIDATGGSGPELAAHWCSAGHTQAEGPTATKAAQGARLVAPINNREQEAGEAALVYTYMPFETRPAERRWLRLAIIRAHEGRRASGSVYGPRLVRRARA